MDAFSTWALKQYGYLEVITTLNYSKAEAASEIL